MRRRVANSTIRYSAFAALPITRGVTGNIEIRNLVQP